MAVQDSDSVWSLSPPARDALLSVLHESSAALSVSWTVVRSAPPPSTHGNPICTGTAQVPLAGLSRMQLLDMLQVRTDSQSSPQVLASIAHGNHCCCKCTLLLASIVQGDHAAASTLLCLNPELPSCCEPNCSQVIWQSALHLSCNVLPAEGEVWFPNLDRLTCKNTGSIPDQGCF